MRKIALEGSKVKRLREDRDRGSTQKELAHEVRISERKLRTIENASVPVTVDVATRLARAFNVPLQDLAATRDNEVPASPPAPPPLDFTFTFPPRGIVPRFDKSYASVMRDESELFKLVSGNWVIISHILTPLTAETSSYAEELLQVLGSLTWANRTPMKPIDGLEGLALRRRIRELLVLLRGNDVWV